MSRDDGFAIADTDTGLYSDPKVVALARRLRDPIQIATHMALYEAVRLASWGAGHRVILEEAAPAWWMVPTDDVLANLVAVGLLDATGAIPERAWNAWFLPAWERREVRREKARKGGRARPRTTSESAWSNPEDDSESTAGQPVRTVPSVPTVPSSPTVLRPRAPRDTDGVDRV